MERSLARGFGAAAGAPPAVAAAAGAGAGAACDSEIACIVVSNTERHDAKLIKNSTCENESLRE